jgi:hypothetical protein
MQSAIAKEPNLSVLVGTNTPASDVSTRELSFDELNQVGGGEAGGSIK